MNRPPNAFTVAGAKVRTLTADTAAAREPDARAPLGATVAVGFGA
jgi:hypothetical protein